MNGARENPTAKSREKNGSKSVSISGISGPRRARMIRRHSSCSAKIRSDIDCRAKRSMSAGVSMVSIAAGGARR